MDSSKQKNKKIHACPFTGCTAAFNRPYRLLQHQLVHAKVKAFACTHETCTKEYTTKSHLNRHIKNTHNKSELNVLHCCTKCLKIYANRQNLKRHMKVSHINNNKYFTCDICKLFFKKKHQLRAHMYIHNGVKAFRCQICAKEFITLCEKKKHMRNHKTYLCELCSAKFNRWTDLIEHKKNDHQASDYICSNCGKLFKERQHIIRHMKKHIPKAPMKMFHCPYENCHRNYSRNSNLKQHILIKHEGRTFDCLICEVKLSTKAKLNEHIERHSHPNKTLNSKKKGSARKKRKDHKSMKASSVLRLGGIAPEDIEADKKNVDDVIASNAIVFVNCSSQPLNSSNDNLSCPLNSCQQIDPDALDNNIEINSISIDSSICSENTMCHYTNEGHSESITKECSLSEFAYFY